MTLKLTGARCLCRTCGEYFNSVSMFDRHRVGAYPARRCLTVDEMQERGHVRNAAGFWIERGRLDHTRRSDDRPETRLTYHPTGADPGHKESRT